MDDGSPWRNCYTWTTTGFYKITKAALTSFGVKHPDRILDTVIGGDPAKVLLFDKPMLLGQKVIKSTSDEYWLYRIHVRDLPCWPPRLAAGAVGRGRAKITEYRLKAVSFKREAAPGQEGVELLLEGGERVHKAWVVGPPANLLKCIHATLGQKETLGKKLIDVQDVRLVCPG